MAGLVLGGTTSGTVMLDPPAVAGSTVITLPATSGTMALTSNIPAAQWTTSGSDIYYTTGNVGIGTTAPGYQLEVKSGSGQFAFSNTGTNPRLGFAYNNTAENAEIHSSSLKFFTGNSGTFSGTERMRLDASGYLMLNTTGLSGARGYFELEGNSATTRNLIATNNLASGTGSNAFVAFSRNGTYTGGISQTGTTSSFVTSSDYRLKDNIAPMTGALAKVALLKPVTYTWKLDGSDGQGFIAHELQEVVPDAVTGEKDEVNEDGSIKSQGIDTSYLVATLTAAIQEQQALIENLTTRLSALENK